MNVRRITLTVSETMGLDLRPREAAREGEQNVTACKVVQPAFLDGLNCRAEFGKGNKKTFMPVIDRHFVLPPFTAGNVSLQLVYTSNDGEAVAKTTTTMLTIGASVNAASPSNPGFADGLTLLQHKAICGAGRDNNNLVFSNMLGAEVACVPLPEISGSPGAPGFSPDITVFEDTDEAYRLKITTAYGEFITPNLRAKCTCGSAGKPDEGYILNEYGEPVRGAVMTDSGIVEGLAILRL